MYADSKFEVKFVPAGQNFELDILASFTNDSRNMLLYVRLWTSLIQNLSTTCRLVAIINNSFKQGLFSITLKTAIVKPLMKSDTLDKELLKNCRPVSV